LKPVQHSPDRAYLGSFNQPKTLSGIETSDTGITVSNSVTGFNQPKTLSGIETNKYRTIEGGTQASTNPKPFQGLKRGFDKGRRWRGSRFNQPKTLSGIETGSGFESQ